MKWFISEFNKRAWQLINKFVLENAPGVTLVYGPRGVGKSALLRCLYQQTQLKYGSQMTDGLSFARQYAYAAHENKFNEFRQRYRMTPLLLIDDLQTIAGKLKSIEELHYTYEAVISHGGKLVISFEADSPNLDFLGERLASRFLSGVVIPIDPPLKHELERYLLDYIHAQRLYVDPNVVDLIAERTYNLTDVIRTITQFVEFAETCQDELSFTCFQAYWEKEVNKRNSSVEPNNIMRIVSQIMGIPVEKLLSSDRKHQVNEARQMAIYTIRTLCQLSYPALGRCFNRNHNTMITAYNKMYEKLAKDQELYEKYKLILKAFKSN